MERQPDTPPNSRLDDIWCVIPIFNNGRTIKQVAEGCRQELPHVVIVDDGSTDIDVAAMFSNSDITVLTHEQNLGKGQAILTALEHLQAQGARYMITIDGDGQLFPEDIRVFLPLIQDDDSSIIIGCRDFSSDTIPGKSRFGRDFSNFWLRLESGAVAKDSQSGFRAYPVNYLSQLQLSGRRYDFEVEVLTKAVWAGLKLKSVDIRVWYPEASERVSSFRPFVDNARISHAHAKLVGRRLLPWPHKKLVKRPSPMKKLLAHPRRFFATLLKENATPGGLAASAAVATLLAVLPLVSVHMIVILYVTSRLNLNKVMALAIQNLYAPPFVPMACIEIGYYMRYGCWLTDVSMTTIFSEMHHRLLEWLLGSLILAPALALIAGSVVFLIAAGTARRSAKRG